MPIDLGRQLFVDDFLIEETTMSRSFHKATYHAANPILRPEFNWETYDDMRFSRSASKLKELKRHARVSGEMELFSTRQPRRSSSRRSPNRNWLPPP